MVSEERTPLELAMLAAWLNVRPDQIPAENRAQVCPHTMAAWKRVGEAALEAQAAGIVRLREAGTKLAGFAGHDSECEDVTGAYPGSCSCGYSRAWKAWNQALGETE